MRKRARPLTLMAVLTSLLVGLSAHAKGGEESTLERARGQFAEALVDQEAGRYTAALVKLIEVRHVRDTSPVRYQMARAHEGLGHYAKARELYLRVTDGTQIASDQDAEIAAVARQSAARLVSKIGYVAIAGPTERGDERLQSLDDEPWIGSGLREVDPGEHTIQLVRSNGEVREIRITVAADSTVSVRLFAATDSGPNASEESMTAAPRSPKRSRAVAESPATPWAWVSLGAGGVLLTTGVGLLLARESAIGNIKSTCGTDNLCSSGDRDQVESWRSRARALGPLGATATTLGALGLAAGGALLWFGPKGAKRQAGLAPSADGVQIWAGGSF